MKFIKLLSFYIVGLFVCVPVSAQTESTSFDLEPGTQWFGHDENGRLEFIELLEVYPSAFVFESSLWGRQLLIFLPTAQSTERQVIFTSEKGNNGQHYGVQFIRNRETNKYEIKFIFKKLKSDSIEAVTRGFPTLKAGALFINEESFPINEEWVEVLDHRILGDVGESRLEDGLSRYQQLIMIRTNMAANLYPFQLESIMNFRQTGFIPDRLDTERRLGRFLQRERVEVQLNEHSTSGSPDLHHIHVYREGIFQLFGMVAFGGRPVSQSCRLRLAELSELQRFSGFR